MNQVVGGRMFSIKTNEGIWTLSPSLSGLKFIVVEGHDLNKVTGKASRELVWLRWFHPGRISLPSQLSLKKLRVLEIFGKYFGGNHLQKLWKDASDAPIQLRVLILSGCKKFHRFPESIGSLKHLKKLVVREFMCLKSLPRGFCELQSLEHLELDWNLSSLPDDFGDFRNLRYLILWGCESLKSLPGSFKRLTLLQYLRLMYFYEVTLESDMMKDMTKLEYINLRQCSKVEELPPHITNQRVLLLTELHLHTESLREVPVNIGELSKLQKLSIHGSTLLTRLPTSLGDLSSLTALEIYNCRNLEYLPDSLGRLSMLENLSIEFSGVRSLSVGGLSNLQQLGIVDCPISELDLVSGSFSSLLCNLKKIALTSIRVSKISISEDCCPRLKSLILCENGHLTDIEDLPKTLEIIKLDKCAKLEVLPSFAQFSSLQVFELKSCFRVKKIAGLEELNAENNTAWSTSRTIDKSGTQSNQQSGC